MFFFLASFRSLILSFCEQGKLPRFVSTILISEHRLIITNAVEWTRKKWQNLSFRFLVWGVVVLVASEIVTGLMDKGGFEERFQNLVPWEGKPIMSPLVVSLPIFNQTNQETYLKDCLTITKEVKAAGAKAVVIDFSGIRPNSSPFIRDAVKKLGETEIVIFAEDPSHPAQGANIPLSDFSIDKDRIRGGTVHRLTPCWYATNPDVLVALLRQYHNYSPEVPFRIRKNVATFGDYEIPIDGTGSFFMDLDTRRIVSDRQIVPMYITRNDAKGTLEYIVPGTINAAESVGSTLVEQYGRRFKGKFVFIMNISQGLQNFGFSAGGLYAVALANMLDHQYFLQSRWLHLVFAVFFLLLIGVICRWLRTSFSIPLLLIVVGGSLYLMDWLLHIHHIYIQMAPFVVSVYSAALIFPLLRFLHDHRREAAQESP